MNEWNIFKNFFSLKEEKIQDENDKYDLGSFSSSFKMHQKKFGVTWQLELFILQKHWGYRLSHNDLVLLLIFSPTKHYLP